MWPRLKLWMQGKPSNPAMQPPSLGWRVFWVGLAVRLLYMTLAHTYRFRTTEDHFQFGWEMGRIGRALATGRGFADPFDGHSGPTAWTPPLYPLLIGGVFRVFGVYTRLSAWVLLALNSVFSAATAPAIMEIARRCFHALPERPEGNRGGGHPSAQSIALWSGWLWALYPAAMQYAVRWVWDMSLTALLMTCIFVVALRVRGVGDAAPPVRTAPLWAAFGLLWGMVALSNATLLLLLPVCGVWMLAGQWRDLRLEEPKRQNRGIQNRGIQAAHASQKIGHLLAGPALATLLCLATIAPWTERNWSVFHAFIPTRGNFGAEFDETLKPEHMGFPWGATVPVPTVMPEHKRYVALGEHEYVRQRGEHAKLELARRRPWFLRQVLKRAWFYWVSVPHADDQGVLVELTRELNFSFLSLSGLLGLALALRNRIPGSWLFAAAFLLLPLPYYAITVQARFRHPIEPLICILSVYLFQSAERSLSIRRTLFKPFNALSIGPVRSKALNRLRGSPTAESPPVVG
jgi:hypothetical protein